MDESYQIGWNGAVIASALMLVLVAGPVEEAADAVLKPGAALVALSACETARGQIYRGEGVVGLTRAFLFAGASRAIVSLWKVEDAATKALRVKFQEGWRGGAGAAKALRPAQQWVASQDKWKDPECWAAWQLWSLPE